MSRKQAQVSSSEFKTHAPSGADVVRKGLNMVPMPGKNLAILKRSIDSATATAQADLEASLEPAPDPPLADPQSLVWAGAAAPQLGVAHSLEGGE